MRRGRRALVVALALSVPALVVGLAVRSLDAARLASSQAALADARVAAAVRTL